MSLVRSITGTLTTLEPGSAVRARVRGQILDVLGVAAAAAQLPVGAQARALADTGRTEASLVGGGKVSAADAALVNGTLAHALDFDDTHLPSVLHPSAAVVPAALAVGEARGRTLGEVVRAVAVGEELVIRLGLAGRRADGQSAFFERGWHATSACGAVGSALAAGVLLGLDAHGLADAMGVAASFAGGLLEANRTGGTVKQLHCGWAAHAGVFAARAVERGFSGPPTVIEGPLGFLAAFCGEHTLTPLAGWGEPWHLLEVRPKLWPANHFLHAAIDAALALRGVGAPARVEIGLPHAVLKTVAEPDSVKRRPRTGYQARFSAPFAVATALCSTGIGPSPRDFADDACERPDVLALVDRSRCVADPWCDERFPAAFPAVVSVWTASGGPYVRRVDDCAGGLGRPVTAQELGSKYRTIAGEVLPRALPERLLGAWDGPIEELWSG